ncbi:uncharacterized protein LOC135370455 [Ornithodoros turicata]|uniref:uncharacterized protein LOC135370455 n=1 Tax=Ornithodoros turicata TaxID=34597 RepID=UPI0031387A54
MSVHLLCQTKLGSRRVGTDAVRFLYSSYVISVQTLPILKRDSRSSSRVLDVCSNRIRERKPHLIGCLDQHGGHDGAAGCSKRSCSTQLLNEACSHIAYSFVTECKNDLIVEMASKRMAIPDIIESSEPTTNDEVVAEMPSKDPKLQKENKKEAQKRQLKELVKKRQTLKDSSESSDEHNDLVPRKKLLLEKEKRKQLEEDNRALRKELDAERKLCRKLQEALLEKRDVSYSTVLTAGTSSVARIESAPSGASSSYSLPYEDCELMVSYAAVVISFIIF